MQAEYQGLCYTVNEKGTRVTIGAFSPALAGQVVRIPETIDGLPVTVEADPNNRPAIRELVVPGGVKLKRQAFVGLRAEHVELQAGLELPDAAFEGGGMKSVHMEPGVRFAAGSRGNGVFAFCQQLAEIELPEGIEVLPAFCFTNCISLARVRLPGSLRVLGHAALIACAALPVLRIPEGVVAIGREAFVQCAALTSVVLPQSLAYLADNPFAKCKSLRHIYVPGDMDGVGGTQPLPKAWYDAVAGVNPGYGGVTADELDAVLYAPKTWKQAFKSKAGRVVRGAPDEAALRAAEDAALGQAGTGDGFLACRNTAREVLSRLEENAACATYTVGDLAALQKQLGQYIDAMQAIAHNSFGDTAAILAATQEAVQALEDFQRRFWALETEERESLVELMNACAALAGYPAEGNGDFDITGAWRTLW